MDENTAIIIEHVYKDFHLPQEKIDTLKSAFVGMFRRSSKKDTILHALQDINITIKKGEFFGIVGRNGSGKSTLLKILANIYQPTKGAVQTSGKLVPFIELGVGFNPELTGRENVYLNGAMFGFSKQAVKKMYKDIVEFAELEKFMDQKLKNYSTGMQVRLAFSMATRSNADILIVDEVLAVGDADFQKKCFSYFKTLKKDKKTVVFVSHSMDAVREYCDRAVLIENSRIVFEGSANDTAKEYTRLFIPQQYEQEQQNEQKAINKGKWGAGGVDIDRVVLSKHTYTEKDETIDINYTVEANDDFKDEIIAGITIKDEGGTPICGTNTKILFPDKRFYIGGKKSLFKASWKVPNIFNDGNYIVEPAIDSVSRGELLLWWDNAASFNVVNEHRTPYVVAPKIMFTEASQSKL